METNGIVRENLQKVRENIESACRRSGRDPKEVTLIAVSKTKPVPLLLEAYEKGERDFGVTSSFSLMDSFSS